MFVTVDLPISLESELAALLADYDAFVAAEDTLLAADPGLDGAVVDPVIVDPLSVDPTASVGDADAPVDPVAPPADDPPAPNLTATDPTPADPVDPAPVDPADGFIDPGVDAAPFDFFLATDELAFDLNEAALVGRRIGGEFFDFA
ncbi:hypothetical protein [Phenylobacterium sp.]|uniref:hypothetical protein n=1 Tax=Phenylobacterium sp. TaxID=1871053 RepID=UPI003BAD290B